MTVKLEIKDQLAKLLATEDLMVEHKSVSTASFDVDRRVLVLPTWDKASNNVYDLLVGHEVGHALYTPNEDLSRFKVPPTYINVTEDARIEKLIKRKFPGLSKSFYRGYWELNEQDFFGINDEDRDRLALIDRINLYFKGNLEIQFEEDEKEFVDKTSKLETFEEACDLAREIYVFTREKQKEEKKNTNNKSERPNLGDDETQYVDEEMEPDSGDMESSSDDSNDNEEEFQTSGGGASDHFEPENLEEGITDTNLKDRLEDLASESNTETKYLQVPSVNVDTVVVPTTDIWEYFDRKNEERRQSYLERGLDFPEEILNPLSRSKDDYNAFRNSAKREVSYLVKEFEMKKSADAYARTTTARTGVLDTKNLHTYKFNEDIFKKMSVIPEGKNHGLIFILDWSGSMYNVLQDTVKQLLNLVWFCRKVNIPFEVYAFTNEWYRNADDCRIPQVPYGESLHQESVEYDLFVGSEFNLLNVLSSKSRTNDFEDHCRKLFHLSTTPMEYPRLTLSGTPLNEAIISLHALIPQFKKVYGVEKLNTIILTDGEAQSCPFTVKYERYNGDMRFGTNSVNAKCVLRDRKLGRTYGIVDHWIGFTKTLLTNLAEKFSEVNFIGIRLMSNSQSRRFISHHSNYDYDKVDRLTTMWKKHKSIVLQDAGYKKYFGLSSNSLSTESEFDVSEDATKSQIKRAFVKSCGAKKLNKKILSEFIDLIV